MFMSQHDQSMDQNKHGQNFCLALSALNLLSGKSESQGNWAKTTSNSVKIYILLIANGKIQYSRIM